MSNANFITIQAQTTTGTLGALPRIPVLVTRETVSGFTPDPLTGLIKINSTDYTAFVTANSTTSYGLINALRVVFAQVYSYQYVYILSAPSGVTSADLTLANSNPRAWSFLTVVDQHNGDGTGGTSTNFFADLETIKSWGPATYDKVVWFTYSKEESVGVLTLPSQLVLGGSIGSDPAFKTIVSNSKENVANDGASPGNPIYAYNNIALAVMSYIINGPEIARSAGSLSDAHDFAGVGADTYSNTSRSTIANASLAQYNGAKDRAGSLFMYDTQMNAAVNPPLTDQIEALLAGLYIKDYVYVYVHNALQAAGQTGLPNDDTGIQTLLGLVRRALRDCFDLGLILALADGSPDFTCGALTAAQVTQLSPNWQTTGIWPAGVITANIRRFSSAHYVTFSFTFQ